MSQTDNEDIPFNQVLGLVDNAVFNATGKHLSNIEILVLQGTWQGQKYPQIANAEGYTLEYLKNDIGPKLWKHLSDALGEKVSKTNLRAVLQQKLYQQQQENVSESKRQGENFKLLKFPQPPCHNLPPRDYTTLVGREAEVKKLLEWFSFEHPTPRIAIEGMGGVGKTTLVLDVARYCLQASQDAPWFESIIFTSAKTQQLTTCGILMHFRQERTLGKIFQAIARTLPSCDTPTASFEEAWEEIHHCLKKLRTLLIVDNLETHEQQEDVLGFLYDLPATVKVVITSREPTPFTSTIRLAALPQPEAICLIQRQAREKDVQLSLEQSQQLYQTTAGVPAAIVYAISQLAAGYAFGDVSPRLTKPTGDFSRFYFQSSLQPLQNQPAYRLLMALALFAKPPVREALCAVAAVIEPTSAADSLARLQQLSLIGYQEGRYTMLPLTRGYVLSELATQPEFEQSAHNRWVNWYLSFTQRHGGKDWREWQDYQPLEQEWENITEVMEWCITRDRYTDVCHLWQAVKCYTYSQAYRRDRLTCWDMPLDWLNWLIQEAQTRQDWSTAAQRMSDRAWKLTLMGQSHHLAAAGTLFTQAWELRHHQTVQGQVELAIHTAVWHIQQQDFDLAKQWLERAKGLLDNAQLDPSFPTRYSIHILYYQGEIAYKTGDYEEGQTLFEQIVGKAQAVGWRRATFLAKDFLADIAIKQGHLDQAQKFLTQGLRVAQENGDRCSGAYTKRSLAQLEQKRGRLSAAYRWATEAMAEFESLGMIPEAIETQALLQVVE
ncbi:MAG: tetratricopeptide repeat protein [Coleofasciculaceae cyanobacterium]